jgi:hypothetical protein
VIQGEKNRGNPTLIDETCHLGKTKPNDLEQGPLEGRYKMDSWKLP